MKDYIFRGGEHPNRDRNEVEKLAMEKAQDALISDPEWNEKGPAAAYGLSWFNTYYCSQGPVRDFCYRNRPYPEAIELETTTACDMACTLCENVYWDEKNINLSWDDFLHIMGQFPDLKWIGLTGIGQSWLNPNYMRMLEYCKNKNIYIENFDNFKHINSERSRRMIEIGVDKLYVSLDAATKETHDKVHKNSNWDVVMDNIKEFDRIKKKLGKRHPKLCFHFIVMKDNIHEMADYLQMIHDLGVDVWFVQFTRMLHRYPEVEEHFTEIPDDIQQQVMAKGHELGIPVSFNMNSANKLQDRRGCTLWTQPFIFADGTVISDCHLNEGNHREWQRETSMGNILKQDFKEIWYGPSYDKLLNGIQNGQPWGPCARCQLFDWRTDEEKAGDDNGN